MHNKDNVPQSTRIMNEAATITCAYSRNARIYIYYKAKGWSHTLRILLTHATSQSGSLGINRIFATWLDINNSHKDFAIANMHTRAAYGWFTTLCKATAGIIIDPFWSMTKTSSLGTRGDLHIRCVHIHAQHWHTPTHALQNMNSLTHSCAHTRAHMHLRADTIICVLAHSTCDMDKLGRKV